MAEKPLSAIQVLKDLKRAAVRHKYTSIPDFAIPEPKDSDKTANGLTKCIIDYLNLTGHHAERVNRMGRRLDQRKTFTDVLGARRTVGREIWIPGGGQNGTADISAVLKGTGKSLRIEVKIAKDKQSEAQQQYQKQVEQAGGLYYIAKDFQSFYDWFKTVAND